MQLAIRAFIGARAESRPRRYRNRRGRRVAACAGRRGPTKVTRPSARPGRAYSCVMSRQGQLRRLLILMAVWLPLFALALLGMALSDEAKWAQVFAAIALLFLIAGLSWTRREPRWWYLVVGVAIAAGLVIGSAK
jgi:hypothetical protein